MVSSNLLLIFLLSHFFVQQIIGSCTGRNHEIIYAVCTFKSLYKPNALDINVDINNDYYYSNYGSLKYKIIVTESFLPTLDSYLFGNHDIAVLEIRNCNVNHLNISDLYSLIKIDLSHNNISNFDYFNDLLKLEEINLSYNNISKINNPFSESQNLKDLNLSHNKIQKLTDILNEPFLFNLDLSYNYINNVSKTFFNYLKLLNILNISNNNITTLELGMFKNLKSLNNLDLSHNYIKILEYSSLSGLNMLTTLDFSYNYITSIPGISFHNFHNLKSLNVKSNKLTKLDTEDLLEIIGLTNINFDENPMSCEMISHLLKQFRKSKVDVVQGSSHGNSSIYGMNCVKIDEFIASKKDNPNELIQKFYSDFKSSAFMTLFEEIKSNLNSSIIQDIIEKMINPEEKSNITRFLGNFTDLIERNDKIVHRNQMNINKQMDNVQNNLNMENDLLKNVSADITKNAERTKDDIIKMTEDLKSMYNLISRDGINISNIFHANEEKKLKNGEELKQMFQKMVQKFEGISNMYSKMNDSREIRKISSETISIPAIFICIATLLVLISGILIAQIVFKIYFNKKTSRILLQNELKSIG